MAEVFMKSPDLLRPEILFEDPHLIVLSKPAGLLSQGDHSGVPSLVEWLRQYVGRNYIGLVHRLDRNTSGIMVVAKRSKSAQRLTESLTKGLVKRTYLGWAIGSLTEPQTWKDWVLKSEDENQTRIVGSNISGAKEAVTHAKPIGFGKWKNQRLSLLEFELETGRSHQIRVQAAHHGVPLLGDQKYGSAEKISAGDFPRPALHAWRLRFPHPMTGALQKFEAPMPKDFNSISKVQSAEHRA